MAPSRPPVALTASWLTRRSILSQQEVDDVVKRAQALMDEVGAELLEDDPPTAKAGVRRIKRGEWPDPTFVDVGVRGDLSEFDEVRVADRADVRGEFREARFIEVVADVMDRRMATDPGVVVLGEDVHRLNGGTNGAPAA